MKILFGVTLFSGLAWAQSITGVAILKGTLRTKTVVNAVSADCKVKVAEIRNIKEEDAYGFPGYSVLLEVSLNGPNIENKIAVAFNRQFTLINFWIDNGKTIAKDLEYFSADGALLYIKPDGRLKSLIFPFQRETITCVF